MIHEASSICQSRWDLLLVAEVLHRVANDYTRAVSFASLMASKASTDEARSALNEVANHLQIIAKTHKILRPLSENQSASDTRSPRRAEFLAMLACEPSHRGAHKQCLSSCFRPKAGSDCDHDQRV
jgi:hypothetical protein